MLNQADPGSAAPGLTLIQTWTSGFPADSASDCDLWPRDRKRRSCRKKSFPVLMELLFLFLRVQHKNSEILQFEYNHYLTHLLKHLVRTTCHLLQEVQTPDLSSVCKARTSRKTSVMILSASQRQRQDSCESHDRWVGRRSCPWSMPETPELKKPLWWGQRSSVAAGFRANQGGAHQAGTS